MAILEEPIKEVMKLQNYIDGEWVESESDQILDLVNLRLPFPAVYSKLLEATQDRNCLICLASTRSTR